MKEPLGGLSPLAPDVALVNSGFDLRVGLPWQVRLRLMGGA